MPRRSLEDTGVPFHRNFNSILRRDHQKNFLCASRICVGRGKEPILGYVTKNDEEDNTSAKVHLKNVLFFCLLCFFGCRLRIRNPFLAVGIGNTFINL